MEFDNSNEQQLQTRSVSCKKLPELFVVDKKAARAFFGKFGAITKFIMYPKKQECIVEFESIEAAQKALNYQGNIQISPTPTKVETAEADFIDPDVQSELDLMYPVGTRQTQQKQGMESFMRNQQSFMMKPRMPAAAPRQKTEPLSVSVADPRLTSIARNELENLAKKPARTYEEKLQVLDARDKLYRLINAKSNDINKATSTKGTCKDMCPEKERLMREARLQVASFELSGFDSSMDPKKAIKQYSRSAADAETPLPHELRPETSLKTTMTYLLHNIMNLCDDDNTSIGDWFHFVWDRTRGIRKDITQQELCSLTTVELVEQCVRFHIHCAARLIAEDPSIFDHRINTENLTKCLQTLKYMYNDLKLKNVKCPHEAEFRAYVVLLNLNESGNFLWEIKQLEKNLLNSREIRFALDVYFATANNNYVKFFNLVREASYMNACILLRYFTQVRTRAINIIMGSYTPRRARFNFNISYLQEILAFEDYETTVGFMTHHGLVCNTDEDIVYLDRSTFGTAETPYQMERLFQLVESKMEATVAEAVCGGSLPSPDCFLNLTPHTSFNSDGTLKRGSFYAEDQNGPSLNKESLFKIPKGSPPVSPGRSMFQTTENPFYKAPPAFAAQKPVAKGAFGLPQIEPKPANPFASKINFAASTTSNSIFGATPSFGMSKKIETVENPPAIFGAPVAFSASASFGFTKPIEQQSSNFTFTSPSLQKLQEAEKKRKEEEAAKKLKIEEEKLAKEKAAEVERERIEQEMKRIEEEKSRLEVERKRREEIAKEKALQELQESCESMLESLIDEVLEEKVTAKAEQAVDLFVKLPKDFYEAFEFDVVAEEVGKIYRQEFLAYVNQTKLKYEALQSCFQHWRETTKIEIKRREKLSTIGCSILNLSLEQQAEDLYHPEQAAALSNMKQYLTGSPQQIVVPDMTRFTTINLFESLKLKSVESRHKIFWKLLLSIPYKGEEKCLGFSSFINKWLLKTFSEATNDDGIFYFQEKTLKHTRTKLSICLRKLQGADMLNETGKKSPDVVKHSNGIVFFTTATNLQASRKRLQNILDKLELPVPVSLIVYKNQVKATDEEDLSKFLDLSNEVNVSSFEINIYYECHEKEKNLTQVIVDSCQFLSNCHWQNNTEKLFDLQMQHMLDFFQITVGDEMWKRVELSCRQSGSFRSSMTRFNSAIHLFNQCLDKLMQMVTNDFRKMPMLPEEFRKKLEPVNARIPQSYEYFPEDWRSSQLQRLLIEFIHDLKLVKFQVDSFRNFEDFKSKLMTFLTANMQTHKEKVFQAVVAKVIDFMHRQNLVNDDDVKKAFENFCWLSVLGEIVVGKFNEVYQQNQQLPSSVIYFKKDLQRYKDVPWWYKVDFPVTSDSTEQPQPKKAKFTQPTSSEIEMMLMKSASSLSKLSSKIASFKEVSGKTREASKDFDKYLISFEENFRSKLSTFEEKFKE